jgi:hypothetical protein
MNNKIKTNKQTKNKFVMELTNSPGEMQPPLHAGYHHGYKAFVNLYRFTGAHPDRKGNRDV